MSENDVMERQDIARCDGNGRIQAWQMSVLLLNREHIYGRDRGETLEIQVDVIQ
jgi:hypothetical protein